MLAAAFDNQDDPVNRRTSRRSLDRDQCRALEHAWHQAAKLDHPLNAMITIRPGNAELSPIERADFVAKFWNRLGVWSRRATKAAKRQPSFHCILVREAEPNGKQFGVGEHFHALLHVPPGWLAELTKAVGSWHPHDDIRVQKADYRVGATASGKIKSALGYLTKQRTPQAWWGTNYRRRPGGTVLGKRYRITANLRRRSNTPASIPVEIAV